MKFNCGPDAWERYQEQENRRKELMSRLSVWHRWFAWHPVRLGPHDCRWLEFIERKGVYYPYEFIEGHTVGDFWTWDYRALNE